MHHHQSLAPTLLGSARQHAYKEVQINKGHTIPPPKQIYSLFQMIGLFIVRTQSRMRAKSQMLGPLDR